jgi:hypothetical protein
MKDPIIDKFVALHREVAAERGDFALFAVLEREDNPGRWDVVLAAFWFGEDKKPPLDYFIRKIDARLSPEERRSLSRVVLLDPWDAFVVTVNRSFPVTDGELREITSTTLGDVPVNDGYLLVSDASAG